MATKKTNDQGSEPPRRHDMECFDHIGRRVGVALAHRNYDLAHQVLESAIKELKEQETIPEFYSQTLMDLGVEYRTCAALEKHMGILTVGDFLNTRLEEIMAIRGFGAISLIEVLQRILALTLRYIPR